MAKTKAKQKPKASNQSLSTPRFSKPILIIFALIFAAIGGYAIYRSFAAGSSLSALYALEDSIFPTKTSVTNCSQLSSQAANPTASEVDVSAMTCSGQINFSATPSSPVKYVFASGVKFTGQPISSGTAIALYVSGKNLILWGPADVSNPSDDGIRVEGASNIVIGGGIKTHDNGTQGILVQAESSNVWLDGLESTNNGTHAACVSSGLCTSAEPNYDLSGDHGIYWGDGVTGGGVVNSYIHDQPNGYCIEIYQGNNAGSNSIFAFNTLARCTSAGEVGGDSGGLGAYFYDGGSSQKFVGNVVVGTRFAGLGSHSTSGTAQGNVFWNTGTQGDIYNDTAPNLTVSDSHDLNPQLDASDRPQASSPLANIDSAYASAYLPRTDFTGAARVTADAGAFAVPVSNAYPSVLTETSTANVWLSSTGSDSGANCSFHASAVSAPTASTACATYNKAAQLAQGSGGTNIIIGVIPGNFGHQPDAGFSSTMCGPACGNNSSVSATFECQTGAVAGSVTFDDPVFTIFGNRNLSFLGSCFHFHVLTMGLGGYSDSPNYQAQNIEINGAHLDSFNITDVSNGTIQNSQIGPIDACFQQGTAASKGAPQSAECCTTINANCTAANVTAETWINAIGGCDAQGVQCEPYIHNNGQLDGVILNNNHFTGMNSRWPTVFHQGGLLLWDDKNGVVENNVFDHNMLYDLELNAGYGSNPLTVQNNVFGEGYDSIADHNLPQPAPNLCQEGVNDNSGTTHFTNILYRYNTFASCFTAGSTSTYTNVRFVGNLVGGNMVCNTQSGITYDHNVVGNGGSCQGALSIAGSPFNNYAAGDLTLPTNSPAINYVPCSSGDAMLNFDVIGNLRPAPGHTNCTAGAYETGSSGGGISAPTVSLSANPTSIISGSSSTLTWNSTNATACTASGSWSGSVATSGSQSSGTLSANATYTLSCSGAGGTTIASTAVTVTGSGGGGGSGPLTIGETNVLPSNDSGNSNLLVAQSASLSQAATIQSISFYVTNAAGKLRLGIYDSSGPSGGPGVLKAQTAELTPTTGWNTTNVTSQVSLSPGTYWLAYLPSDDNLAFTKTADSTSSGRYYSYTYAALPNTFSPSPSSTTSHWSLYATLNSSSGGSTVPGDTNNDNHVTLTDLTNLLANWNTNNAACDFNNDGTVNGVDLSVLLSHYGT